MTPYSLYAAVSVGLETDTIINVLNRFSKTPIPEVVEQFIKMNTVSYGKIKLVLKRNHYFVESAHASILQMLLKDSEIKQHVVKQNESNGHHESRLAVSVSFPSNDMDTDFPRSLLMSTRAPHRSDIQVAGMEKQQKDAQSSDKSDRKNSQIKEDNIPEDLYQAMLNIGNEDADILGEENVYSFEIKAEGVEVNVQKY